MSVTITFAGVRRIAPVLLSLMVVLVLFGARSVSAGAQPGDTARALLYVMGAAADDQFTKGTVSWSKIAAKDTPAVQALVRFPDRGVQILVTIAKNPDPKIPASHVIWVQFDDGDMTSQVQELESFVSKSAPQEPGKPLSGAIVPKSNGVFWIALPDTRSQVVYNTGVLLGGAWFEMAASDSKGGRALIMFEKEAAGEQVMREVFEAWTNEPATDVPSDQATLLGCFKDPNNPFDLDGYLERSSQNTPQNCVQICRARGFAYAGVQYSESCLCGNTYGQFGAAANCDMPCTGDASQICGGMNSNMVYATGR